MCEQGPMLRQIRTNMVMYQHQSVPIWSHININPYQYGHVLTSVGTNMVIY